MTLLLLPLDESENEKHSYVFEVWQYGHLSSKHEFNDLNSARKFYAANGNNCSMALKLYIDGELMNFIYTSKILKINRFDKHRLGLLF